METSRAPSRDPRQQYPRAPSRGSAGASQTRIVTHSPNSSSSHLSSSPKMQHAHAAHRYHHASCAKVPESPRLSNRPLPQLSREASYESARRTPVSSFLQERLEKERQAESHKTAPASAVPRGHSEMATPTGSEYGGSHKSPSKNGDLDHRPQSSSSDPSRRKGPALKEMEQVISSLHKQNFDLKLELYHRRERQTALEDRAEALEAEKRQVEEMNGTLLEELEKRDKAVAEAVAMIVMLEAKAEEMAQERNMVRQVEAQGFYGSPGIKSSATPKPALLDVGGLPHDAKVFSRTPSFMSMRSEATENLRNVYLGRRGSVLSLARVTEGASDIGTIPTDGFASPTLSMLSESSFVSVYGQREQDSTTPSNAIEPLALDGFVSRSEPKDFSRGTTSRDDKSGRQQVGRETPQRITSREQYQPIAEVVAGSPLQRIERMDAAYSQRKTETPRSGSQEQDFGYDQSVNSTTSPNSRRKREEKRESLRKVITDAPGGASLHDHLPPTPDTISTSTLHRYRASNDTLNRKNETAGSKRSIPDLPRTAERLPEPRSGVSLRTSDQFSQARMTARNLQKINAGGQHPVLIERPRSADETTVSHHRRQAWDSDSEGSEADSLESDLDIWMRQSANKERGGKASPDLFGFPTSASRGGWAMDAMFGSSTTKSTNVTPGLNSDQMHDLFSAPDDCFGPPGGPPPPPHRRSSLNAQTGSNPSSPQVTQKPTTKVNLHRSQRRQRRPRRNSDDAQMRANLKTPVQSQLTQPPPQQVNIVDQEKGHYPPITRQQGGARSGLVRLWRRSLGSSSSNNPEMTSSVAPSNTVEPVSTPTHVEPSNTVDLPTQNWVNRSAAFEKDRSGATPPPILRNARQIRDASDVVTQTQYTEANAMAESINAMQTGDGTSPFAQPTESEPANGGVALGTRRKWLPGFGRTSNLKSRTNA